jgi:hypothetical protein
VVHESICQVKAKGRWRTATLVVVVIGCWFCAGLASAADVVHLAIRRDGKSGSGTAADPFDASTAKKFDALMERFWTSHGGRYVNGVYEHGKPLEIRLGHGVFETRALSSYGPNAGRHFNTQHWLAKDWSLRGAGMERTEIRNVNPNTSGVWMFNSTGGNWGGPESGGIVVSDLTLNPQKTVHEEKRSYSGTIISADGTNSVARAPGVRWTVGTRIEISGENYNGPTGPWNGGGTKFITAVGAGTFTWPTTNELRGPIKVKRPGEWNGLRLNGPRNRVERVRVINGGANSINETWPLWVSGDDVVIDSCVVERCSGWVSAIASFPGRNRTIRNSRFDGRGCTDSLGIGTVELVENCTVSNATFAIYGDTFASQDGITIRNNTIINPKGGGVVVRPHDHTRGVLITGNRVRGGKAEIGIWVDPLSPHWTGELWPNAKGEKIWIDEVTITGNDVGQKRIEMSQSRNVTITDNVTGAGAFYRMPQPANVSGNRSPLGGVPHGLADAIEPKP